MKQLLSILFLVALSGPAISDEVVRIGGGYTLLNKPSDPRGSLILVPGGDGNLGLGPEGKMLPNQEPTTLPRNRKTLASSGMATLLIDNKVSIGQAALYMKDIAQPVVVIALSRGTTRYQEIVQARPSGAILVSRVLSYAQQTPSRQTLPQTLVIHHKEDRCFDTPPSAVASFQRWGGDKVRVSWIDGGQEMGNPCYAFSYHGLFGRDEKFRELVVAFSTSLQPAHPVSTRAIPNAFVKQRAAPPISSERNVPTAFPGKGGPPRRCKSC